VLAQVDPCGHTAAIALSFRITSTLPGMLRSAAISTLTVTVPGRWLKAASGSSEEHEKWFLIATCRLVSVVHTRRQVHVVS
jgi:hypothetical protein